jgi:hypothetical protein
MSYMPSVVYVARALHSIGADTEWDDAPAEEQASHMKMAREAIAAIVGWQRSHKPNGLLQYCCEPTKSEDGTHEGWAIYDRQQGLDHQLGVIHDPLLAQQIVDELNRRDVGKAEPK